MMTFILNAEYPNTLDAEVMTYRSLINVASIGAESSTKICASQGNSYGFNSVPPSNRCRRFGIPHLQLHALTAGAGAANIKSKNPP